jgi:hypothetical protein
MPTNTRTPSGSDSGVCAPTPSDAVGTVDNILTRIDALEKDVARLKALETTINNLAYISPAYSAQNNALAVSMLPAGVTEQFPGSAWVTAYGTISGVVFPDDFVKNLYGGVDGVLQYPVGTNPASGNVSYIEFDTDGSSGGGNLNSGFNSVLDEYGDVSWLTYGIGSEATTKFNVAGLYAIHYQAQIIGQDTGVRLPVFVGFRGSSATSAICYSASSVDEDSVEISYVNMSCVFEMPNGRTGQLVGSTSAFNPYLDAMPASGTHNFDVQHSSLKILKIG